MILGRHYTPTPLAREVVCQVLAPLRGQTGLRILDPACGEGIFLEEARRFLGGGNDYIGVDVDANAIGRAAGGFELLWDDALRHDWGDARFDAVIGNPPWVSFSGRHAKGGDRAWLARNYRTFSGWPSLHAPFVELALRLGKRVGLLLPEQVCDLAGYGPLRAFVREHSTVVAAHPLGEGRFEGVVQPTCLLILDRRDGGCGGGDAPFVQVADPLAHCPRPPSRAFADIGVHTGNCADKLLQPGGAPVREGKDVHPFALGAPRCSLLAERPKAGGEYYRIGPRERYESVPILVRQTALRPIAALHIEPTYFRNSVLACMGIDGVPHERVVEWLNSEVVGWYHQRMVREASQRAFPQVKLKHLRDLPMPDWDVAGMGWEAYGLTSAPLPAASE